MHHLMVPRPLHLHIHPPASLIVSRRLQLPAQSTIAVVSAFAHLSTPPSSSVVRRSAVAAPRKSVSLVPLPPSARPASARMSYLWGDIENAGPFDTPAAPAVALVLMAGTAGVGGLHSFDVDPAHVMAWCVVAAAALSQLRAHASWYQIPVLAGASLALHTLGYGSIEYVSAIVFGGALCNGISSVVSHDASRYVCLITLALAVWQGFTFEWFAAAYGLFFMPGLTRGFESKRVAIVPVLCCVVSLLCALSRFSGKIDSWVDAGTWTACVVIGTVLIALLRSAMSVLDMHK